MKDFLIGALGGYSQAQQEHNQSLLQNEISRRKQLSEFWKAQSEAPDVRPEARDIAMQKFHTILQTPYEKKLPKGVEGLDDFLAPIKPQPQGEPTPAVPSPYGSALPNLLEPMPPPELAQLGPRYTETELNQMRGQALQQKADIEAELTRKKYEAEAKYRPAPLPDRSVTEFEDWRRQNPNAPVSEWLALKAKTTPQNLSAPEQQRIDAINAYAAQHKLDPKQLTPEQIVDAQRDFKEKMDLVQYRVLTQGGFAYAPRSGPGGGTAGAPAPGTIYDITGFPTSGGQPGVSTTPPPVIDAGTQGSLAGWKLAYDQMEKIQPQLKKNAASLGPLAGRVLLFEVEKAGGKGATKEQIQLMINLKQMVMNAFADGGKQLTGVEKEIFDDLRPDATDTVEQALIKAESARTLAASRYRTRVGVMSPRQAGQVPDITGAPKPVPGSGTVRMWRLENGKRVEYDIPEANVPTAEQRGLKRP